MSVVVVLAGVGDGPGDESRLGHAVGTPGPVVLLAHRPPLLLDVGVRRLRALPKVNASPDDVVWVAPAGPSGALVIVDRVAAGNAQVYRLDGAGSGVEPVAQASDAVADRTGRTIWLLRHDHGDRCSLSRVGRDREESVSVAAVGCDERLVAADESRVVLAGDDGGRVLDARGGVSTPLAGAPLAMIGDRVIAATHRSILVTWPGLSGALRIPFPSRTGAPSEAFTGGSGRYMAVTAGDPAYRGGPEQQLDVWIFDLHSGHLMQLPEMPTLVSLKDTGLAWSAQDELMILTQDSEGSRLRVWRPGTRRLSDRTVAGSEPNSGSDAIVVLNSSR